MPALATSGFAGAVPARRTVRLSIIGFWAGFMLLMSLRAAVLGFSEPGDLLLRRLACGMCGIGLTFGLQWLLFRLRGLRLAALVGAALCLAVFFTLAYATVNWFVFYGWHPPASLAADVARWGYAQVWRYAVVDTSVSWYFFFCGWSLFYLTLLSMAQTAANARRALAAERATHLAQLRALRYQLNPHFLFNSLNTLSWLVMERDASAAERMIVDLSSYLRRILDDDPAGMLTLEEEFDLHRLYLALEARRFEDRLVASFALPDALADLRVPALILQSLVENAVTHGVARTSTVVHVTVSAWTEDGLLHLAVRDDAALPAARAAGAGNGIGLANIGERLMLAYGQAAGMRSSALAVGFEAHLWLPLPEGRAGAGLETGAGSGP